MRTRSLALVLAALALTGCPRPRGSTGPTPSTPAAAPGDDLASAGDGAAPVRDRDAASPDDHRLDASAPKGHDLDVIHLDVVGRDGTGDVVIEAKTPGPYLDKGNQAFAT